MKERNSLRNKWIEEVEKAGISPAQCILRSLSTYAEKVEHRTRSSDFPSFFCPSRLLVTTPPPIYPIRPPSILLLLLQFKSSFCFSFHLPLFRDFKAKHQMNRRKQPSIDCYFCCCCSSVWYHHWLSHIPFDFHFISLSWVIFRFFFLLQSLCLFICPACKTRNFPCY